MLRTAVALVLLAAAAAASTADNPETMAERSQSRARAVLDRAIEANGGAEALRAVEVVRLKLSGQTFPRLQMTTPAPPFEAAASTKRCSSTSRKTGCASSRRRVASVSTATTRSPSSTARAMPTTTAQRPSRRSRPTRRPSNSSYSTTGACRTASPPGTRPHQFPALSRRGPVRGTPPRSGDLRDAGYAAGRPLYRFNHGPGIEVRADLRRLADGVEASEIIFGDYQKVGDYQVPRRWINRQVGEDRDPLHGEGGIQPCRH